MIVNVRGTNGSGKSTIVKTFLERYPICAELYGVAGPKRPEAYALRLDRRKMLYVIGPYQTTTGGIDALPLSADELVLLLEKYRKKGYILFEGVMISTYYGAVGEWLKQQADKSPREIVVGFLDTPLKDCLAGVAARGGKNTKNVAKKIASIESVRKRMIQEGIPTDTLRRETAFYKIAGWLE